MTAATLEAFLARIYVDETARNRFLSSPREEARKAGLSPEQVEAVERIDRIGLELFSISLERKQQKRSKRTLPNQNRER